VLQSNLVDPEGRHYLVALLILEVLVLQSTLEVLVDQYHLQVQSTLEVLVDLSNLVLPEVLLALLVLEVQLRL
jgi:hypothetical protein